MVSRPRSTVFFIPEQVSKRPGRYDEMPKSATMENRQNMEQHVRKIVLSICSIFPLILFLFCSVLRDSAATKEPGPDSVFERLRGGRQYLTISYQNMINK